MAEPFETPESRQRPVDAVKGMDGSYLLPTSRRTATEVARAASKLY